MCFSVTNIKANVQNDSSEFEGLLHEMVSQKHLINQEICHINLNAKEAFIPCQHTQKNA